MKKQLDTSSLENELKQSKFFQSPTPEAKKDKQEPSKTVRKSERKSERRNVRAEERTTKVAQLPVKRLSRRYSFEIYDDQISKLKLLKRNAEDAGLKLTLSDIARQALDDYLKDK